MQSAKIRLSRQQIKLVTDAGWILTKNAIIQHIKTAFEALYTEQLSILTQSALPAAILKSGGKISRGENYLGLPWVVLDSPRYFVRHNIFAIRTMFWWGKFFSTTLHLSGKWQEYAAPTLVGAFSCLQKNDFRICYSGDEWVHDITDTTYTGLKQITQKEFETILKQAPFVKIAAYTGIENIETAIEILMQQFRALVNAVQDK